MRRLDRDDLAFEDAESLRRTVERVALRHGRRSRAQHGAPRPGEETGLEEERHDLGLAYRAPVEALDCQPLQARRARVLDERRERGAEPGLLGIPKRDERAPAALDEERRLAAEEHDVGAGDPRGAGARALRPRERGAVGLRRVGRRKDERGRLLGLLPQALDRAWQRELRAAEALGEVAAAADAERLQLPQLAVDRRVAARDALRADPVSRDDAVPLEEQLGERARVGLAREEPGGRRPAALRRGDGVRPGAREPPRALLLARGLEAAAGAEASLVASPAQTRSQSAGRATSPSRPVAERRSYQKSAPRLRASLIASCASSSGGGSAPGLPSTGASSRK
jgi:hypothetical protein